MNRIFKIKKFQRWMRKVSIKDSDLTHAVHELKQGLIDADLGQGLFKKRIALSGKGKSGGTRVLIATNKNDRWFFLFGFRKNERENVSLTELEALQTLSIELLGFTDEMLDFAVDRKELLEVKYDS